MKLVIECDNSALSQLADRRFLEAWDNLYNACPWAMVYQSPAFITAWYETYHELYQPVIISGWSSDAALLGLLLLGKSESGEKWVTAGHHLAPYSGWLAAAGNSDEFIKRALTYLCQSQRVKALSFGYLPPGTSLDWLAGNRRLKVCCMTQNHHRAFIPAADAERIAARVRKSEKNHINRIARQGTLKFYRVTDHDEFVQLLDALAVLVDLRRGAIMNLFPFAKGPQLKCFLQRLFQLGLLYVTALKAGNQLVTADISLIGKGSVVHGTFLVYSPFFSKCSPGQVHVTMLLEHLSTLDISLDMAPGWDWKDRFQPTYDEVSSLEFYGTYSAAFIKFARRTVKRALAAVGVPQASLRAIAEKARQGKTASPPEVLYTCEMDRALFHCPTVTMAINKNCLADLLQFAPGRTATSRQQFLFESLNRISHGEHFYTCCREGRLIYAAWVKPPVASGAMEERLSINVNAAIIHGLYRQPEACDSADYLAFLQYVLCDQMGQNDRGSLYLALSVGDTRSREIVQAFARSCRMVPAQAINTGL
jgi:CelD/BcsL family acetyltransferase involved in cellulose biosynthesis